MLKGGGGTRNALDSSAPTVMRGKERETPKKKKPSSLRKVTVYLLLAHYYVNRLLIKRKKREKEFSVKENLSQQCEYSGNNY